MNINFNPQAASAALEQPADKPASVQKHPRPAQDTAGQEQSQSPKTAAPAQILQANVTFRRDSAGKFYYVVSDAQSGREIREFPAQEVREAGAGIAEFLEQQAQEAVARHLELKA